MPEHTPRPEHDLFDAPEASPAYRRPLAIGGFVLAAVSIFLLPVLTGVLGMVAGLSAHVKGDRLGLPAAFVAGIGMILGMGLEFLVNR